MSAIYMEASGVCLQYIWKLVVYVAIYMEASGVCLQCIWKLVVYVCNIYGS